LNANKKKVVLAGGSGFIGRILARELLQQGWEVVVLTRNLYDRDDRIQEIEWDGEHVGEWIHSLEGAEAVINLSGRNINCRHTPENLREILESRVNSVRAIAGGLAHVKRPPRLWLQASAIGFYGNRHEEWCNERTSCGPGRLAEVCRRWEETFFSANAPKTRRILFRLGIVLGSDGGALPLLANYTRWFLGGAAGSGRQYISWIHHEDLTRMFLRALMFDNYLAGTYNAVAPQPETNAEFMRTLRRTLYRPWSPPVPAWLVRLSCNITGSEASLALEGCRCAPKRFLESGFEFKFPDLRDALKDVCR
jgi:uncharacterized protein (TIGR01777 family)